MAPHNFTEQDKEKFVRFLNMIAKSAQFNFNTNEVIEYFKLLSHMQQQLLVKIDSHILEVKRVVEPEDTSIDVPEQTGE